MNRSLKAPLLIALLCITLFLFTLDILIGPVALPLKGFLAMFANCDTVPPVWKTIVFEFRLPKALTAILAGAALSVSGLQMQTFFRNPLAGPYVLGISSGASLGVALVVLGFAPLFTGGTINPLSSWLQIVAACIGSGLMLLIIMAVSLRVRDVTTILILGILFGSATSAIINIMQYFSHQTMLKAFVVWSMGSLGGVTSQQLGILALVISVALILSLFSGKMLNVMLLGESYAKSMGLNIRVSRLVVFLSTSLLAGGVTAFCGPIGFIGIAVPHITRMLFRTSDHRLLIPAVMLTGSSIMLLSDILSQLPGSDNTLPINSVTALIGIPVIIYIIIRNRNFSTLR